MNWQEYCGELDRLAGGTELTEVRRQTEAVKRALVAFAGHSLPAELPELGFSEEFIMAHLLDCPNLLELDDRLGDFRQTVIENFGIWHIFTSAWADDLALHLAGRRTLQVMAGNAVLAASLADVRVTDSFDWAGQDITRPMPWTDVENIDAVAAVEKYAGETDAVIMEWAPDTDDADWRVLQTLRDMKWDGEFIVIGERNGATDSQRFWRECKLEEPADLNLRHRRFDFIDDRVYVVR